MPILKQYHLDWIKLHENHLSSAFLIGGFILDSLTLRRADLFAENILLIGYILLCGISIFVANTYTNENNKKREEKIHFFSKLAMQFAFGGLFSAFLVFYSRSTSFSASAPFLLILVGVMIGNEVWKEGYKKLVFQISVFFFTLFSFLIFFFPVVFRMIGVWMFILSALSSLLIIVGFLYLLSRFISERIERNKKYLIGSIGTIFILINILYFTNLIPPIPLAMQDSGMYYSVMRNNKGEYVLRKEKTYWTDYFSIYKSIPLNPREPLVAWSSIYSPSKLDVNIFHEWQYFDEAKDEWVTRSRIPIPIIGGREGGYRLYSKMQNFTEGKWRVDVETERGQIIGRLKFEVTSLVGNREYISEIK